MNNNNINVLLTRPLEKSQLLAKELSPFVNHIEISPLFDYQVGTDHSKLKQLLTNTKIDAIIFVSQAAAHFALQTVPIESLNNIAIRIAVGTATANALQNAGVEQITVPNEHTTEGLLVLPELQDVKQKSILIIRGNGGRETLKQQLQLRGANVAYNEVYKRVWFIDKARQSVHQWQAEKVNCVVVTSNELLEKALSLSESAHWLKQCIWVVASERIANKAKIAGLNHVHNAQGASNISIIKAIMNITHPVDINYD